MTTTDAKIRAEHLKRLREAIEVFPANQGGEHAAVLQHIASESDRLHGIMVKPSATDIFRWIVEAKAYGQSEIYL